MSILKKVMLVIMVLVLSIVLFEVVRYWTSPLTKSDTIIRQDLLTEHPVGTQMNDVLKYIENKEKWEIDWVDYERG
ncbi:hypothetical protein [Paenibacillus daejeonensis]|uniref:hypothetical protein n=1 Tax=Paenibacillus daejeonensis TaxID=135193 RepID=UPI00038093A9|nr:hypothetical protein [Paenibacillus daejeonensis]